MSGLDIALLVLAVIAAAGLIRLLPRGKGKEQRESLARKLGLEAQGEELFTGRFEGREVRLEFRSSSPGTVGLRLGVELRRRLAPGLDLDVSEHGLAHVLGLHTAVVTWEPEEDGPLFLGLGQDPIRARLAADRGLDFSPVRQDPVLEDVELHLAITVGEGQLELGLPQVDRARIEPLLRACVELVELLEEAEDAPWRAAAELHGLALQEDALRGEPEGLEVEVRYETETRIEVRFGPQGLPPQLRVHASGEQRLGNPVLDLLVGFEGCPPEELDERFEEPELAEALLAVVHQFPGSSLEAERVLLLAPGRLRSELEPALGAALALARAMRR